MSNQNSSKVDYTQLQNLLAESKWQQADEETMDLMLEVVDTGGIEKDVLNNDDIKNFPCADLDIIDRLWIKYSNGRFGFSVQKRIWESVGGNPNADYETIFSFGEHVGWRLKQKWISFEDVIFDIEAPEGHFPFSVRRFALVVTPAVFAVISCITSALARCNISNE
ncbi:GUN4 domain-containing protein [Anabaena subtropica]|uniref:GUN4 domain-containing protein n=1 Tax=Anabaena subtropica FACHB-260 TaxID=2692884 RepID=A0ABR8CMD5_9NOST|nr:GUN4 domain-containing protein [Anabaena subtropica]MBD2344301.1 GUN4 domain-containing protein [Anabaena subtropica FACHB-260]